MGPLPNWLCKWLMDGGDPNHLPFTWMILQVDKQDLGPGTQVDFPPTEKSLQDESRWDANSSKKID